MAFSEVFKELRISKNLSQAELAEELKISKSAVSMYERGQRNPDFETLEIIADYFNVDMNYLLGKNQDNVEKKNISSGYYLDEEAAKMAQEIYENPDLRILFDTTRKAKAEDLKFIAEMVKRMSGDDN